MKEQLSLTRDHILHVHQQIISELSEDKRLAETRSKAVALMTEEILLLYMDEFGENVSFSAELRRNKGGRIITLRIPGREMDPNQNVKAYNYRYLMKYAQDLPVWSYEDGCNVILLDIPCSDSLSNVLSFCWKYASGIRLRLVLGFIIQAVGAYFNFRISYYVAQLIIQYTNNAVSQATAMAVAVFAFVMLEEFSICASDLLYEQVSRQIYARVQNDLVKKFLDIQSFSITSHGNNVFIRRITDDAETLSDGLSSVSSLNVQVASYIGTMVAVFSISPMVFIYELIILAALFLAQTWRVKAVSKLMISFKEANEKYYGFLTELVQGFHDIRALNLKKQLLKETDTRFDSVKKTRKDLKGKRWKYRLVSSTVLNVGDLIFMLLLAWLLSGGRLEGAFAVVLYNYHSRLGNKVIITIMQFSDFSIDLKTSYGRINSLISGREFPKETFGSVNVEETKGEIEFQNVTFSYNKHGSLLHVEEPILKDMSFIVKPGQTAALVGSSGCGKSTIFKLLNKQYTPNSGLVLLDGTNLDLLDEESLRSSIALINQFPYLFNASIRDNLAYVKPDMSEEEMIDVCKKACIHDDIMNMEEGYDTVLSEGGADLSGGQRQRLAIARGLLKNPPVLLLDEATSALDNTTQNEVMTAIKGIQGQKTVVLIAHRLSSITYADIIMMIRDGQVWARGSHEELMENCAEYRELYLAEQEGVNGS